MGTRPGVGSTVASRFNSFAGFMGDTSVTGLQFLRSRGVIRHATIVYSPGIGHRFQSIALRILRNDMDSVGVGASGPPQRRAGFGRARSVCCVTNSAIHEC